MEAQVLLQVQHCLRLGRHEEARELAARLRQESESRKRGIAVCVAGVAEAALAPDAGTRKERLATALTLAATRGYVLPLVQGSPPLVHFWRPGSTIHSPPMPRISFGTVSSPSWPGIGTPPGHFFPRQRIGT